MTQKTFAIGDQVKVINGVFEGALGAITRLAEEIPNINGGYYVLFDEPVVYHNSPWEGFYLGAESLELVPPEPHYITHGSMVRLRGDARKNHPALDTGVVVEMSAPEGIDYTVEFEGEDRYTFADHEIELAPDDEPPPERSFIGTYVVLNEGKGSAGKVIETERISGHPQGWRLIVDTSKGTPQAHSLNTVVIKPDPKFMPGDFVKSTYRRPFWGTVVDVLPATEKDLYWYSLKTGHDGALIDDDSYREDQLELATYERSPEEIAWLKQRFDSDSWDYDPSNAPLEDTPGFEAHKAELAQHEAQRRVMWQAQDERQAFDDGNRPFVKVGESYVQLARIAFVEQVKRDDEPNDYRIRLYIIGGNTGYVTVWGDEARALKALIDSMSYDLANEPLRHE